MCDANVCFYLGENTPKSMQILFVQLLSIANGI